MGSGSFDFRAENQSTPTPLNMTAMPAPPPAPAHVPPELVRDFDWHIADFDPLDPWRKRAVVTSWAPVFYSRCLSPGMASMGAWIVWKPDDIRHVLQNPALFSSEGIMSAAIGRALEVLPLEADPVRHKQVRKLLNPLFSPAKVQALSADIREMAVRLIEGVRAKGGCDFVPAFSRPFPVLIFLRMMGMPLEQVDTFLEWEYQFLHTPDPAVRNAAGEKISRYFVDLIADRRRAPRDDLFSAVVNGEIDGRPVTDAEALGIGYNLFTGGLDTVTTTSEWLFAWLAQNPEMQARLRADPARIPDAMEELLRLFPVIMTQRYATADTEIHGVRIAKGDPIGIPLVVANYDPEAFGNPLEADFTRGRPRHLTFGSGPHTCLGVHLARRELQIAIEEWLARVPEFRVVPGAKLMAHPGIVGLNALPLEWSVG